MYKQNLGTATSYDSENKNLSSDSPSHVENGGKIEDQISPDMKLEDLLRIYDQEKIKFLSSFIGQVWYPENKLYYPNIFFQFYLRT